MVHKLSRRKGKQKNTNQQLQQQRINLKQNRVIFLFFTKKQHQFINKQIK